MKPMKKNHLFNLIGASIIVVWLIMIGLLIKKSSFNNAGQHAAFIEDSSPHQTSSEREWMEIFLKKKKVGYSVSQVSPIGGGFLISEEVFLRLNLLGQANAICTTTQSVMDHKFILKSFVFRMKSGIVTYQVSGKVDGNRMVLKTGEGPNKKSYTIRLKAPPVIGSGMARFFRGRHIEVGQSFKFPVFDPATMAQKDVVLKVTAKERIVINRVDYGAFRLETEVFGQPMIFWLDNNGSVLKEEGFIGLTLVKSSVGRAKKDIESSGGEDFYRLASISVKRKLPKADRMTYLKIKMQGFKESSFDTSILDRGRQKYRSGILEIIQEKRTVKPGYSIPFSDNSGKMEPFLSPEPGIESDHRAIVEKARAIVRGIKDPGAAMKRIVSWVYRNVKKQPVITVPDALEVLKTMVGDCNEHAVLLTALLRASGIPARVCVGLVYARGGFYYHAWTEGYAGKWISMDPTLNQMPADATHIKLVQGGLHRQVEIISLIGKLKMKVVDYRYD